jgi:hypothetical protein
LLQRKIKDGGIPAMILRQTTTLPIEVRDSNFDGLKDSQPAGSTDPPDPGDTIIAIRN